MNKTPTAEELFIEISSGDLSWCKDLKQVGIETAKRLAQLHVTQALEAADNNAQVEIVDWEEPYELTSMLEMTPIYGVDSDSIINAYPLSNIK